MTADSPQPPPAEELAPLVYDELRRLAAAYMRRERPGQTLQPTALVHEAYLRLAGAGAPWHDERHFVGIAARSMRQILVERARARGAQKRWAGLDRFSPTPSPSACRNSWPTMPTMPTPPSCLRRAPSWGPTRSFERSAAAAWGAYTSRRTAGSDAQSP